MATHFTKTDQDAFELSFNQRWELSVNREGKLYAEIVNSDGDGIIAELTVKDVRTIVSKLQAYLPPAKEPT